MFISDLHIGSKGCKSTSLLKFLKNTKCDNLYIVGDAIDALVLKSLSQLTKEHYKIFQRIIKMSKKTKIFYCPGNHDYVFKKFCGTLTSNFQIEDYFYYKSLNGKIFFVTHGDTYDKALFHGKKISKLFLKIYEQFLFLNNIFNFILKRFNFPPICLVNLTKIKLKQYIKRVKHFESRLVEAAKLKSCDGVICGHIHFPKITCNDNVLYLNTGDWVENCTAIVEHLDGTWEIIKWKE